MSLVQDILDNRRKSELQTMHQFWFPGEAMISARDELLERVTDALVQGSQLSDAVSRLSKTQRSLLEHLLQAEGQCIACQSLLQLLGTDGTPSSEIENAVRVLTERGFISRQREQVVGKNGSTVSREVYFLPRELADNLAGVLDLSVRKVKPADQLSQKRLAFEIDFSGKNLEKRISKLEDPVLRRVVRIAMEHHGVADISTPGVIEALNSAAPTQAASESDQFPKHWRQDLEQAEIGTVGSISLKDYGILVNEPALILFQEWIHRHADSMLKQANEASEEEDRDLFGKGQKITPERILEVGADLAIDIDRMVGILSGEPVKLTRGGKIAKRLYDSIHSQLFLTRIENELESGVVESIMQLCKSLGLIECYADQITVQPEQFAIWRKLDLSRQIRHVLDLFIADNRGDHWSFHQEALRKIFLESIQKYVDSDWLPFDSLITHCISTYLLELEEREVRQILRERREEDFSHEKLNCHYHDLSRDLVYWVVNRILPLGICELGQVDNKLSALRLTALGRDIFGLPYEQKGSRILVNPNFEIMLFCEGLRGMCWEVQLSRFAERLSAEGVRRYRVTRESMRLGIRQGISTSEICQVLTSASDHPLPEPVLVSLRDWGKNLEWIKVENSVSLRGLNPERAQELSDSLEDEDIEHCLCPDGTVVLSGPSMERLTDLLDQLRNDGWLVRDDRE